MTVTCTELNSIDDPRGYRIVKMRFSDSVSGRDWYASVHAPTSEPIAVTEARYAAKADAGLSRDEPEEVWSRIVDNGEDGEPLTTAPRYTTSKRIAKKIIRRLMVSRDAAHVIACESLIEYLRLNYTAAQLAAFLDTDTATIIRINNRVDKILNNKTAIIEFLSSDEEIEDPVD